ncbi:hypothetical protein INT48_005306 [Thamnidium elegans]|uniref:Nudix hydrolase domain-containing protein n=1 Tax=Thamnidium elegans TaxID=101142 RepID=A0A8H7VWJ8_9FUNG|nr:hypothetical protein INT48_005306 [Thamnidium elegans]
MNDFSNEPAEGATFSMMAHTSHYERRFQHLLDQTTPYVPHRWAATGVLLILFMLRIYILNLFLAFLTPKFDPSVQLDTQANEMEEGPSLPMKNDEEFKPFIRRLPEFKFCIFDIPVYWPILLGYFIILFCLTMRRQIGHMIRYRYIPFDLGKKSYNLKYIIDTITTNQVSEFEPGLVRNASVAAIIRWRPYITDHILSYPLPATPAEFLNQCWINDCHGEAEILFIQRASHPTDVWSGHIAFPGGKDEPSDKSHLDTVIRECREEIGLDLASPHFIPLGTLEHRKITSLEGKKLIMTLVPHETGLVFLQVSPITPEFSLQISEVAETYWISIRYLLQDPIVAYAPFIDANLEPGQKVPWPTSVRVPAIQFKTATESSTPHLWGMTLRMTQDIVGMKPSRTYMTEEEYKEFENKQAKL